MSVCYWCGLASPLHQTRCPEGRALLLLAMNIVNQLFDAADVPVAKRQEINDRCDEFVVDALAGFIGDGLLDKHGQVWTMYRADEEPSAIGGWTLGPKRTEARESQPVVLERVGRKAARWAS